MDDRPGRLVRTVATLPNKVTLTSRITPGRDGARMEFRVTNGSAETLTGLDVQMCVMLKALNGFELRTNDNKVFQPPFAAARDASGRRWIITGWERCSGPGATRPAPASTPTPGSRTARPANRDASRGGCRSMKGRTSRRS